MKISDFFKVLSDETRLRCLILIFEEHSLCVCELVHALSLPQAKISRHLSILKLHQIIIDKRMGQWVIYSPHPKISSFKKNMITVTIKELKPLSPYYQDRQRLETMENRPALSKVLHHV